MGSIAEYDSPSFRFAALSVVKCHHGDIEPKPTKWSGSAHLMEPIMTSIGFALPLSLIAFHEPVAINPSSPLILLTYTVCQNQNPRPVV